MGTRMVRIQATVQLILHILTTCLHLDVAISVRESHPDVFKVVLVIIGITSVFLNTTSMVIAYWNMDFGQKRIGEFICVLFHLLQLGPLWRYLKLLATVDDRDVYELDMLRLVHVVLQDALLVVIEMNMILESYFDLGFIAIVTVVFSVVAMSLAYTCVSTSDYITHHKVIIVNKSNYRGGPTTCHTGSIKDQDTHKNKRPRFSVMQEVLTWISHAAWHLFCIQARLLSISVFVQTTHLWAILIPSIHLLCHYAVIFVKLYLNPVRPNPRTTEVLQNLLLGYTQLYDHLGKHYEVCASCVYYIVVSLENFLMIAVWFIGIQKDSLNTALFIYIFICHVTGTLIATIANQKGGRKLCCLNHPLGDNDQERGGQCVQHTGKQSKDTRDVLDVALDFDTVIEFVGDGNDNQNIMEGTLGRNNPQLDSDIPQIISSITSWNENKDLSNSSQDVSVGHNRCSMNEASVSVCIDPHHHCDHESSNSRNTNTVMSTVSGSLDTSHFSNSKDASSLSAQTDEKKHKNRNRGKCYSKSRRRMLARPLPEPPWPNIKVDGSGDHKFERRWRSFTDSSHQNVISKAKRNPLQLNGQYQVQAKAGLFDKQTNGGIVSSAVGMADATNIKCTKQRGWLTDVTAINAMIPSRRTEQRQQPSSGADLDLWNWENYTTDDSTTDYASLPPSRLSAIYGTFHARLAGPFSAYSHRQRWKDSCSTCSSTDYFDLDDSEYSDTWTWPPSKPGITKESIYEMLPHDYLSSQETVTRWLHNVPSEHFV